MIEVTNRVFWEGSSKFSSLGKKENFFSLNHYPLKLILFSAVFLFALKLFFSTNYAAIVINSIMDLSFFFILYGFLFFSDKFIPEKYVKSRKSILVLFYGLVFFNIFIFAINSIFLDDAILVKYSLMGLDWNMFSFLLLEILPWRYILLVPLIFAGVGFVSLIDLNKFILFDRHMKKVFLFVFLAVIFLFMFNFEMSSNLYANTIYEGFYPHYSEKIKLDKDVIQNAEYPQELFDKGILDYDNLLIPSNKKVLVFVMEQTSYNTFVRDAGNISSDRNFFKRVENNTHIFTNYYASNQDSRTTVWTFLHSKFIPFESYVVDWTNYYGHVLKSNSLVELFNKNNYSTQVVASIYTPSLLLSAHNWSGVNFLKEGDGKDLDYVCLNEFEFQHGCEDFAILEDVKRILKENKDGGLFMLQEFIYGHGTTFYELIGKSRTEYYNDYLFELYEFIESEGMLEDTLIFIVSDHGEKGYFLKGLWNFQLPLIVIGEDLDYREVDGLYSHLDFKDILLSYVEGSNLKESEGGRYFIGQTQSSDVGYVNSDGEYFLAKVYGKRKVNVRDAEGLNRSEIESLMAVFFKYRSDFKEISSSGDYWCEQCDYNELKAGLKN